MRNLIKLALTGALAIAMASFTTDLSAQTARRSTGTSTSSTSTSTTTAKRSTSSSTTTPASTSSSQVTRSNKSTTSATPAASTTTAKRATTTTPASTSSTQVDRNTKSTSTTSSTPATSTTTAKRATTTTPASTSSTQVDRTQKTGSTSTATTSRSTTNAKSGTTQSRTTTPASSSSSQVDRTKKSTTEGSSTTRQASSVVRSTSTTTAAPAAKEEPQSAKDQAVTRSNVNVTSKGLVTTSAQQAPGQPMNNFGQPGGYMRMDDGRNMMRIPPRERDFMTAAPPHFYSPDPHYFGYRVHSLPPRYSRTRLWGVDYYYYDNVYYRRYGDCYMICRPPFGVSVSITVRDRVFPSIRFSYYYSSYHILNVVDKNYKTIFKQNQQIAANNALLARQNAALALNTQRALSAYELANALGLVQSYAGINTDYFYEDGVFYVINKKGYYEVIVPPAGALVDVLPDDYQTIVFNGVEYYLLDDTVYRLTLYDGYPYLEVLGQMPVSMSNKYNLYY